MECNTDNTAKTTRHGEPSRAYAWYVVFALCLCQILSSIDAKLPFILVESLKRDLQLSDAQIGLVTGPVFSLTYAICAIPIAKIADASSRTAVISTAIIVWSAFTGAAGLANGFIVFLLLRAGVAMGESALTPSAHSLLSDYHSEASRHRVIGLYHLGLPLGYFIALALGGYINDEFGWQSAFFFVGASGAAVAVLIFLTVREPVRNRAVSDARSLPTGSLKSILGNAVLRNLILGGMLFGLTSGAVAGWAPAYIMRAFNLTATETGTSYGAVIGLLGMVGTVGGGFIGAMLTKRGAHFALTALAFLLFVTIFTQIGALMVQNYVAFLILMAFTALFSSFYIAPTFATVQSTVDPGARSFASAVTMFAINGIGFAFGSFVAGWLSDMLRPSLGDDSLRWALISMTSLKLWAVIHFWKASRHLKSENMASIGNI